MYPFRSLLINVKELSPVCQNLGEAKEEKKKKDVELTCFVRRKDMLEIAIPNSPKFRTSRG